MIHDYLFTRQKYGSEPIHKVFYHAILTDGVNIAQAKMMYYAVVRFNDRWERESIDPYACNLQQAKGARVNCYPTPFEGSQPANQSLA